MRKLIAVRKIGKVPFVRYVVIARVVYFVPDDPDGDPCRYEYSEIYILNANDVLCNETDIQGDRDSPIGFPRKCLKCRNRFVSCRTECTKCGALGVGISAEGDLSVIATGHKIGTKEQMHAEGARPGIHTDAYRKRLTLCLNICIYAIDRTPWSPELGLLGQGHGIVYDPRGPPESVDAATGTLNSFCSNPSKVAIWGPTPPQGMSVEEQKQKQLITVAAEIGTAISAKAIKMAGAQKGLGHHHVEMTQWATMIKRGFCNRELLWQAVVAFA